MIRTINVQMVLLICAIVAHSPGLVLYAAANGQDGNQDKPAKQVIPIKKEDLRYDGKSFDEWRKYLLTELKPELRAEGVKALTTLGQNGYGADAARAIIEVIKTYKPVFPDPQSSDPEQKVLGQAHVGLARLGKFATPVLIDVIKNPPSEEARQFAILHGFEIATSQPQTGMPLLVEAMLQPEKADWPDTLHQFSTALIFQTEPWPPVLLDVLKSKNATRKFVDVLSAGLQSNEEYVPVSAAHILGYLGKEAESAVPHLLTNLKAGNREAERSLESLKKIGVKSEILVSSLLEILKDEQGQKPSPKRSEKSTARICFAIDSLGEFGADSQAAVPTLVPFLKDEQWAVKRSTFKALASIGPAAKAAIPALLASINVKTEDEASRLYDTYYAINTLNKVGVEPSQLILVLDRFLKETKDHQSVFCYLATKSEDSPKIYDAQKYFIQNESRFDLFLIAQLGQHGSQARETVPTLIKKFSEWNNRYVRIEILTTLGKIGPEAKEALPLLQKALTADDAELRQAAETAIKQITGKAKSPTDNP